MSELWTFGPSDGDIAGQARHVESEGWDGMVFMDTQNLRIDCYVAMTVAATATTHIKLSPGVTNPGTRHPAVAASAIASIDALSGGRASFAIGRGDSALAHVGMKPVSLAVFEAYVRTVRDLLHGHTVPFERLTPGHRSDIAELGLAGQPDGSRLQWLDPDRPPVPVDVVATGPRAIAVGGRNADLVTFTVGADIGRVAWAIDQARTAAAEAGRDPSELRFGAYVNLACHPDKAVARRLVSAGVAVWARLGAMYGTATGPRDPKLAAMLEAVRAEYDASRHASPTASQTQAVTDELIDRYAIVGSADECFDRLASLAEVGLDRIIVNQPNAATRELMPAEAAAAHAELVGQLLPRVRAGI